MIPVFHIILSLIFPIAAIYFYNKKAFKRPYIFSLLSFAFCGSGIIHQLVIINKRVFNGDVGGIEDTIKAVILISVLSLIICLMLNLFMLDLYCEKKKRM